MPEVQQARAQKTTAKGPAEDLKRMENEIYRHLGGGYCTKTTRILKTAIPRSDKEGAAE
jgi:hypothetical protein